MASMLTEIINLIIECLSVWNSMLMQLSENFEEHSDMCSSFGTNNVVDLAVN